MISRTFHLLALLAAARVPDTPPPEPAPSAPIIVTGIRIDDYRNRLRECLARNCPPDEDGNASLALAEALLLEGNYVDARSAVSGSLDRNRRQAVNYPESLSDLFRAHSRLSRHFGRDRDALRSAHGIFDALHEGLPREDHRHFTARLELAETLMRMGRLAEALREVEALRRAANAVGRTDVAALAELRSLLFEDIATPRGRARRQLLELAELGDPARRIQSIGARILLSQIYRSEGDAARADALIAGIPRRASAQRQLLHAPEYTLYQQEVGGSYTGDDEQLISPNTLGRLTENYDDKWIDVGFWVMPDGRVGGVEVVRRGGDIAWARPLLQSIRGRLYSPAAESSWRLERYTFTAGYENEVTGTRIARRSPRARIEYLDLSEQPAPAPTPQ